MARSKSSSSSDTPKGYTFEATFQSIAIKPKKEQNNYGSYSADKGSVLADAEIVLKITGPSKPKEPAKSYELHKPRPEIPDVETIIATWDADEAGNVPSYQAAYGDHPTQKDGEDDEKFQSRVEKAAKARAKQLESAQQLWDKANAAHMQEWAEYRQDLAKMQETVARWIWLVGMSSVLSGRTVMVDLTPQNVDFLPGFGDMPMLMGGADPTSIPTTATEVE